MNKLHPSLTLLLTLVLMISTLHAQPWQQLGSDIDGEFTLDNSGNATSISADGKTVAVGAYNNDNGGNNAGQVKIYRYNGTVWIQLGNTIVGEDSLDQAGNSVSISADGTTVSVGAKGNDGNGINAGHVRVFRYNGAIWQQLGGDIDGEAANDNSGTSTSISADGNTVAIGAPNNDAILGNNNGHVRIYSYNGSAWIQMGADIDGEAVADQSGFSVSISSDGTTVAIGAPYNDGIGNVAGHVRVYKYNGSSWVQVGIDIDGETAGDNSGISTSISGDGNTVAIGATFNTTGANTYAGHVRVYRYNGSTWLQLGIDLDGEALNDRSGESTSLNFDGNTVAIGAISNDDNGSSSGHVRVYKYVGSSWQLLGIDLDGEAASDRSGCSTSLSADGYTVTIGAYNNDGNGSNAGHVRVYNICVPTANTDTVTLCAGNYTWINGVTYTTNNTTATHTLINANGCDSVVTLKLTLYNNAATTNTLTACDSLVWIDGITYFATNTTATYLLTTAQGCDSLVTLNLTIKQSNTYTETITACDSLVWINGITYFTNNTTATHTLTNVGGCDSVVTLNLIVINSSATTDVQTACDALVWIDGNTYISNNNTATYTLTNTVGCDSVVTLNLTIYNSVASIDVQTVCSSYTWIDGNTYTSNNNTATFTFVGGAASGCDSVVTLNLTINNNTGIDYRTICGTNFIWIDGNTYVASNTTATYTLPNAAGCDSVVTLNLTLNNNVIGTDVIIACGAYTWIDGNTYNFNNNVGTFNMVGGAASGCDSLVQLNLTVIKIDTTATTNGSIITSNTAGAVYQWLDCNNNYAIINGETNQSFSAVVNGNYAVEIIKGPCIDTSLCIPMTTVGVLENDVFKAVTLFPNPTKELINITLGGLKDVNLKVFDIAGQLIDEANNINTSIYQFKFNRASGIYFIEVNAGEEKQRYKLIKN